MTVIVRSSYIVAETDGEIVRFSGKRTVTGFAADPSTAKDIKFPDRKFSREEIDNIIRAVKAHSESSYIGITFSSRAHKN